MEINTREILNVWEEELVNRVIKIEKRLGLYPKLLILRVGDRHDTNLYVRNKVKKAEELGIDVTVLQFPENISQNELNCYMYAADVPTILQLPLPDHLDAKKAINCLDPIYDVDGLTIKQKGLLVSHNPSAMVPATAKGIIRILENLTCLKGKRVSILSRSELIGKPLAQLILHRDGIPTILHSQVPEYISKEYMLNSDIVITACGKRAIFNETYFNIRDQIIIDCSMAKDENIPGVGDLDKDRVMSYTSNKIASGYGHTGPATVLGLIENVVIFYENYER